VAAPGEDLDRLVREMDLDAVAVELDLVNPARRVASRMIPMNGEIQRNRRYPSPTAKCRGSIAATPTFRRSSSERSPTSTPIGVTSRRSSCSRRRGLASATGIAGTSRYRSTDGPIPTPFDHRLAEIDDLTPPS
jgi:hypothetical protein